MGRRGPQPKPTKLRVLEGNPGKTKINRNEVQPITVLEPPAIVSASPEATREWERVVRGMPPDFYGGIDSGVLAVYCISWVMWQQAVARVATEGAVQLSTRGERRQHPSVAIADKMAGRILQAADRLGMAPAARARMEAPSPIGGSAYSDHDPDDDLLRG